MTQKNHVRFKGTKKAKYCDKVNSHSTRLHFLRTRVFTQIPFTGCMIAQSRCQ